MKTLTLILCLFLIGCTTTNPVIFKPASIEVFENRVEFNTSRPAKMSMKKDGAEYTYDSQAQSFMSKIIGAMTLGVLGARR